MPIKGHGWTGICVILTRHHSDDTLTERRKDSRRSEVAALTLKHIQQRDNRRCIGDLVGKHGHVRTIPMPTWVKVATDAWTVAAGLTEGHVLRPVGRGDRVLGERMTERSSRSSSSLMRRQPALPELRPMTFAGHVRKCGGLRAESLSKSSYCWGTRPCKRLNGTSARNRIWSTRQTTESS
jgi:hypothetical protein